MKSEIWTSLRKCPEMYCLEAGYTLAQGRLRIFFQTLYTRHDNDKKKVFLNKQNDYIYICNMMMIGGARDCLYCYMEYN